MKSLACFALIIPAIVCADLEYEYEDENDSYCTTCECCSPCCCIPQEKPCIDCECYTPKFYDLQCDWGIFISADFLYWYARETGLYYALKFTGVNTVPNVDIGGSELAQRLVSAPVKYEDFKTEWAPGFRVGLGLNLPCDGWDIYANWTHYHNRRREEKIVNLFTLVPPPGQFGFLNPWINPAVSFTDLSALGDPVFQGQMFYQISAKWRLSLNIIDLELGRKYWLSKCFVLRPYFGVRGAKSKIRFNTTSLNFSAGTSLTDDFGVFNFRGNFNDRFKDRFWGVGILGGIQPTWYLTSFIAIFGNLDASLLWGKFKNHKIEQYSGIADINDEVISVVNVSVFNYNAEPKHDFFGMQPIIDLGAGFRWEKTWCCDRVRTSIDLGWEHHIWFNHTHRNKLLGRSSTVLAAEGMGFDVFDYFNGVCEETHDIAFGGFVLHARLDF